MTPLTPEQVEKLRLPDWFELVPISKYQGDLTFEVLCKDKWQGQVTEECRESAFGKPRSEVILAYLAENIANGHVPPEALDDVWRRVEGRKTDLEIVLAYRSVEIQKNEDGHNCWITLYPGNGKPRKIFDGVVFAEVVKAARKWIEEQGK